jgi:hypothetical protein
VGDTDFGATLEQEIKVSVPFIKSIESVKLETLHITQASK